MTDAPLNLESRPIHLGLGASAVVQPAFPADERAMAWYADYGARSEADGVEGRLVSQFTFSEDWASWEMHPGGAEVVVCIAGTMTLIQQIDDAERRIALQPGDYAINPPGVWHTADVSGTATALFITAGLGTEHRGR